MISYEQLRREPISKNLFSKQITTLQGLLHIAKDASFIALDTEHGAVESQSDRVLHQVGLAYLDTMGDWDSDSSPRVNSGHHPRLQDFYLSRRVQSLTLNIDAGEQRRNDLLRIRGSVPSRRAHRFGEEQNNITTKDLDKSIHNFIANTCPTTKSLVLVGFGMAAEWTYLLRYFPSIIPHLSSWLDIRDIAKDIALAGTIPGRLSLLQLCGYHWADLKPKTPGHGTSDNAGDDAVSTLALARALLDPANREKLRLRQSCGEIAGARRKGYQNLESLRHHPFTATIRSRTGRLPAGLDSAMKLARRFLRFSPRSCGLLSAEMAYLTFANREQVDGFVQAVDGLTLPTGETLLVGIIQELHRWKETAEAGRSSRQATQERRAQKRLENMVSDTEDLGGLFS